MSEVQHTLRLDYLEPHYNLVHRVEFEHDVQAICQQYQIAVLPYSPLANGFLTGKYSRGQVQAAESARAASVRHRYDREEAWHACCHRARLAARPAGCDRTPSRSPFRPTALSLPGGAHGDIDDRLAGSPRRCLGLGTERKGCSIFGLHALQHLTLCCGRKRRKISSEELSLRLVSLRYVPPRSTR